VARPKYMFRPFPDPTGAAERQAGRGANPEVSRWVHNGASSLTGDGAPRCAATTACVISVETFEALDGVSVCRLLWH